MLGHALLSVVPDLICTDVNLVANESYAAEDGGDDDQGDELPVMYS